MNPPKNSLFFVSGLDFFVFRQLQSSIEAILVHLFLTYEQNSLEKIKREYDCQVFSEQTHSGDIFVLADEGLVLSQDFWVRTYKESWLSNLYDSYHISHMIWGDLRISIYSDASLKDQFGFRSLIIIPSLLPNRKIKIKLTFILNSTFCLSSIFFFCKLFTKVIHQN